MYEDSDARVRKSAFTATMTILYGGAKLGMESYQSAVVALSDDNEDVRIEACKLIWLMANTHSHLSIQRGATPEKIVDHGFKQICNMVSDISPKVRGKACQILGSLRGVSRPLLMQSLSKKLIVAQEAFNSSDPFDKTQIADEQPEIMSLSKDNKLIESSAHGAFIHGLEDEYMEVRASTVDSICELSLRSEEFALESIEFMVDMFNDEIDAVRVNSLNSLRKIGNIVSFSPFQLAVVLAILEDRTPKVRFAAHQVLRSTKLTNITCLQNTITALLNNLTKYPSDMSIVFLSLKEFGRNHPGFIELVTTDLLKLDPRFLAQEAEIDDIYCKPVQSQRLTHH